MSKAKSSALLQTPNLDDWGIPFISSDRVVQLYPQTPNSLFRRLSQWLPLCLKAFRADHTLLNGSKRPLALRKCKHVAQVGHMEVKAAANKFCEVVQGVSERALRLYSKSYCVAAITKTFTLKGVQTIHRSTPSNVTIPGRTRCGLLHYGCSKHCTCPLNKCTYAFK
jgi:hypothetical protein